VKTPPSNLIPCVAAFAIPALCWYFSSRRKLFIKIFIGYRPLQGPPTIPEQPEFRRGMRTIAILQFVMAILMAVFLLRLDLFGSR
jgi:hypothetical protein